MPSFEKSPAALVARFAVLAGLIPDGKQRLVFGYPAVTINGNLCFSLHGDHAILRLPEADRADLGRLEVFEPMPGRPMRGYVVLPDELFVSADVASVIERSAAHVRGLAPKQPRGR